MISIIIPVYNVEKYLRQCLDSMLAQTFYDYEVIITNDGSTDSSGDICDEYAARDSRFRVIHKANGGLSSARNAALDIARGQYIFFLDSDDFIAPTCLQILLETSKSTGRKIVTCNPTHSLQELGRRGKTVIMSSRDAIKRTLHQTNGMVNTACGKLYDRSIFDHERFTEGRWYEDLDAFYRFYSHVDKIAVVKRPLYYYRNRESSFLGHWSEERLHVLTVMETMRLWMTQNLPEAMEAVDDREFSAACNMLLLMSRHSPNNPAILQCWEIIKRHRVKVLFGNGIRLKNRIGAAVALLGKRFFCLLD